MRMRLVRAALVVGSAALVGVGVFATPAMAAVNSRQCANFGSANGSERRLLRRAAASASGLRERRLKRRTAELKGGRSERVGRPLPRGHRNSQQTKTVTSVVVLRTRAPAAI